MSIRPKILTILRSVIFSGFAVVPAQAQDYDLAILNGRVVDPETRYDAVANVGVKDGKIAVITEDKITAKETIDATGHVVAPGFIDTHWHYDRPWSNKLALRDGRTTVLDLEIGTHGPYVDQWYKEREGKNQVNYGQAVGHEFARAAVLDGFKGAQDVRTAVESRKGDGWCCKRPTLEEGNRILQLLDEGLQACHFNNPGYNLVHELLVRLRERGMNVWGEIYPYVAGSTALNAVFLAPEIWGGFHGLQV